MKPTAILLGLAAFASAVETTKPNVAATTNEVAARTAADSATDSALAEGTETHSLEKRRRFRGGSFGFGKPTGAYGNTYNSRIYNSAAAEHNNPVVGFLVGLAGVGAVAALL